MEPCKECGSLNCSVEKWLVTQLIQCRGCGAVYHEMQPNEIEGSRSS